MEGVRITTSAKRHGVADADIRHALRNFVTRAQDEGTHELVVLIGPARDGTMLELGLVDDDEDPRVIHVMPARAKYWP